MNSFLNSWRFHDQKIINYVFWEGGLFCKARSPNCHPKIKIKLLNWSRSGKLVRSHHCFLGKIRKQWWTGHTFQISRRLLHSSPLPRCMKSKTWYNWNLNTCIEKPTLSTDKLFYKLFYTLTLSVSELMNSLPFQFELYSTYLYSPSHRINLIDTMQILNKGGMIPPEYIKFVSLISKEVSIHRMLYELTWTPESKHTLYTGV